MPKVIADQLLQFAVRSRHHVRTACRELEYLWSRRPFLTLAALLLVALAVRMGDFPRQRGDGAEYYAMTRSLALEGDLVITREEARVFQQPLSPWPHVILPYDRSDSPVVKGADGLRRGVHAWVVPALVVPFYYLCAALAPTDGAFHCYSVFGLWAVLVCWYLLARYWEGKLEPPGVFARVAVRAAAWIVIFFTPLAIYSHWVHTEVGVFLLLCLFFWWLDRERPLAAAAALGLAAAQNPAVIFWGILLGIDAFARWRRRNEAPDPAASWKPYAVALVLFPLPAAALALHSHQLYGQFSLMRRFGNAYLPHLTFERIVRFYLDPFFGLIWFFPWALLAFFARGGWRPLLLRLALSIPIAGACVAMVNLNSHMVGLRYLVFVYPAFLFLPLAVPRPRAGRALLALCVVFCFWVGHAFLFDQNRAEAFCRTIENKAYVGIRTVFHLIPALYDPEAESFYENALHGDIAPWSATRKRVAKARVSPTSWVIYVEKKVLPPGPATLVLAEREAKGAPEASAARFGINLSLALLSHPVVPRGGEYRLDFSVRPQDFIASPLWGDYLFLKFDHEALKPVALELPDGTRVAL